MKIEFVETGNILIAEVVSDEVILKDSQDAVELMGNCTYNGTNKIILKEENIIVDFFNLKTGVAGEILQKFSTYNCQLAIIGEFSKFPGKSLKDFIFESNRTGRIFFVNSLEEARKSLSRRY
jgi:hypothetical protein